MSKVTEFAGKSVYRIRNFSHLLRIREKSIFHELSAHVYVFLHQTRLSDVIENEIAPCPAVPSLFAVVDDDDDTDVGGAG